MKFLVDNALSKLANLPNIRKALEEGSIIVLEDKRIRIRSSPVVA